MSPLLRLLDLVQRELGASDARAEIGGRAPQDPRLVFCDLPNALRLVAVFDHEPADRAALGARLRALAEAFTVSAPESAEWTSVSRELGVRRLDDELALLAERAGAVRALVIDVQSPVLWGSSGRRGTEDVDDAIRITQVLERARSAELELARLLEQDSASARTALAAAGLSRDDASFFARELERIRGNRRPGGACWQHHLWSCAAIAAVRASRREVTVPTELVRCAEFSYLVRSFANIYRLLLIFDERVNELVAQAAVARNLPRVEKLLLSMPPFEPPPRPGKLVRLPRPR
jgi:hypothetical protein